MYVADLVRAGDGYQTKSFKISHTFEVFCWVDLSLWESGICAYMVQKVAQKLLLYAQSYSSDTVYSCYYILTVISLSQCVHLPMSVSQWSISTP